MKINFKSVWLAFTQFNWQTGPTIGIFHDISSRACSSWKFQQVCSYTGHIWWDISNQLVWLSHDLIDRGGRASHCGNLVIVGAQLRSQSCEGGTASMPPGLNGVPEGYQGLPGREGRLPPCMGHQRERERVGQWTACIPGLGEHCSLLPWVSVHSKRPHHKVPMGSVMLQIGKPVVFGLYSNFRYSKLEQS